MNTFFSLRRCGGGVLWVLMLAGAAWAVQDAPAPSAAAPPVPRPPLPSEGPALQWLSVVLISADMEAGAGDGTADIPPAVQRVLAEVEDFLPFRSYRLHDAGLVGSRGGTIRLRGDAAPAVFEVSLGTPQRTALEFGAPGTPQRVGLRVEFELSEIVGGASTNVLRTTVTLGVGETVVVGTSRVRARGLIAFITAVPSAP